MENLISLADVTKKFQITLDELNRLIKSGKIQCMNLSGTILITEESVKMNLPKIERDDYKQFEHLKGVRIALRVASRKYGITPPTLHRWAKQGYITRLGMDGNKLLLDEADVAYCAFIYQNNKGKQGRWLFHPNGTPYIPKNK